MFIILKKSSIYMKKSRLNNTRMNQKFCNISLPDLLYSTSYKIILKV